MHVSRARSIALVSSAALLLGSTALSTPVLAQAPAGGPQTPSVSTGAPQAAPAQTGVVGRIVVEGAERIEQSTIISYLPIAVGDTVDAAKLDLAVKTLARTDLFADETIELRGTDLVVRVI